MTAFVIAAIVMLVALIPAGMTLIRGTLADSVVGYQFISTVTVLILALLAEGFGRSGLFEFPVLLAVLLFGGALVFVRALERWL
jgi:multisubunit Na+/H+ antiporter MnhF subunit